MNRTNVFRIIASVFVSTALLASPALAEDEAEDYKLKNWQLSTGAGAGIGILDVDDYDSKKRGTSPSDSGGDDLDFAWRLHAWVTIYQYFFLEAGYLDYNQTDGGHFLGGARIPIPNTPLAFLAKVGVFLHSPESEQSDTDADLTYGGGVLYQLPWYDLGWRLDYDYVDADDSRYEAHVLTTGIYWDLP